MGARRGDRKKGAPQGPLSLTPEVRRKLVQAVKAGAPFGTAAVYAGVSRRAFFLWCAKGRDESDRRDDGLPADPDMEPYYQLFTEVAEAKAQAGVRNVALIQKVAEGGAILEETTKSYRDPQTGEMVEERTVKRQAPDWRAGAFWLERQQRDEWGKDALQVEVTGAGGGAVQVETTVDTDALASKIVTNLAAIAAAQQQQHAALEGATVNPDRDPTVITIEPAHSQ